MLALKIKTTKQPQVHTPSVLTSHRHHCTSAVITSTASCELRAGEFTGGQGLFRLPIFLKKYFFLNNNFVKSACWRALDSPTTAVPRPCTQSVTLRTETVVRPHKVLLRQCRYSRMNNSFARPETVCVRVWTTQDLITSRREAGKWRVGVLGMHRTARAVDALRSEGRSRWVLGHVLCTSGFTSPFP